MFSHSLKRVTRKGGGVISGDLADRSSLSLSPPPPPLPLPSSSPSSSWSPISFVFKEQAYEYYHGLQTFASRYVNNLWERIYLKGTMRTSNRKFLRILHGNILISIGHMQDLRKTASTFLDNYNNQVSTVAMKALEEIGGELLKVRSY